MKGIGQILRGEGFRGALFSDESMKRHCSLGVGGAAALLAEPLDAPDLQVLLAVLRLEERPWMVLGGGTNVMFGNGTYPGCVVRLGHGFTHLAVGGQGVLEAGAAVKTAALLNRCSEEGLAGLEFAAGLPGTLGGALKMNAGTRSGELGNVTAALRVQDADEDRWIERAHLRFSYRDLALPDGTVVTAARLSLKRADPGAVRRRVQENLERRRQTQPLGMPSAGCWFRNPPGDSAGRLIDAAGLKGIRVGGAQVSEIHANFLVNRGDAVAADFKALALRVRNGVLEKFGVSLEEEVQVVG